MIGGDPQRFRDLARRVRAWQGDLEDQAASLRRARGIQWASTAASAYQARLEEHAGAFDRVTGRYGALADRLEELGAALEHRQQELLALFRDAEAAWETTHSDVEHAAKSAWRWAGDASGWVQHHVLGGW